MRGFGLRAFGLEVLWAPSAGLRIKRVQASPVPSNRGGWWSVVREPFAGAWQRDIEWTVDSVLAHHAVFTCITLISGDIGKLRLRLMELDGNGIWTETDSASFSPVLREPNRYQDPIQFIQWWVLSKLIRGNTYALKERDGRGIVTALYLLDPSRVTVLVAEDGSVYYDLQQDNLSGVTSGGVQVPASEIIHDRWNCIYHPLVGVSPIHACGAAANLGLRIQNNSAAFFGNGSNPSGILTTPTPIPQDTADRIKEQWEVAYSGNNSGKIAVLPLGMKFEAMRMTAEDSQLIEQLRWTAETVCSTFHVPAWKIGVAPMPAYTNPEIANQTYYSDCLQRLIEEFELCMDRGLGIGRGFPKEGRTLGIDLDLDGLLRMDTANQVKTLVEGIRGGLYTPNGARKKVDEKPVRGGDTIWLQQQDVPIEVAFDQATRLPPPDSPPPTAPAPASPEPADDEERAAAVASLIRLRAKTLRLRTPRAA